MDQAQKTQGKEVSMFFKFLCRIFSFSYGKYGYPIPVGVPKKIGDNKEKTHIGIEKFALDFIVPEGTLIQAAADGVVVLIVDCHEQGGPEEKYADKANHLVVSHGQEFSFYFHLAYHGALTRVGNVVEEGQIIAIQGSTGYTTEPHLHFAIYRDGRSVRPRFKK